MSTCREQSSRRVSAVNRSASIKGKPILRSIASLLAVSGVLSILQVSPVSAYTVITVGTGAPATIEQTLIAGLTAQYNIGYFKNPLASNTYQLTLFGLNPNWNNPPSYQSLVNDLVTVDSYTYVYGWAQGQVSMQNQAISMLSADEVVCSTDVACSQAVGQIIDDLYQIQLSTPQPVPNF